MGAAEPFCVERPYRQVTRLVLICLGLFCFIFPPWNLRFAFFELGWWSVFFGLIVAGAWAVGLSLLASGVFGFDEKWTFAGNALRRERYSPWGSRVDVIRSGDIARTGIRTIEWDSRADSYSLRLHLHSGECLESPDYATSLAVEKLRDRIIMRLRQEETSGATGPDDEPTPAGPV